MSETRQQMNQFKTENQQDYLCNSHSNIKLKAYNLIWYDCK